jgi:low affinity Fe/Cu permease
MAFGLMIVAGLFGAIVGISSSWQLVMSTSASLVTVLMVILLHSTQNRNHERLEAKLDELLRSVRDVRSNLIDLESLPESDLRRLDAQFHQVTSQRLQDAYDDQGPTQVLERSSVTRRAG